MIGKPKIDERKAQNYAGIRTKVPSKQFKKLIPASLDELFAWLGKQGVSPAGTPFMRYHVINMEGNMDVEIGVPIAKAMKGDDRVSPGIVPAGSYASLVFSGVTGYTGNKALVEWAAKNGVKWDRWDDPNGDAFRSRYESFLTDPAVQPDRKKWETEVAIKLADN